MRLLSLVFALLVPAFAWAQAYPSKPIHIIVAFAPGGPVDVVARLAQQKLQDILGQPVVVENRASSTGNLGTQAVARAAPDGYTILANSSAFAVNVTTGRSGIAHFTPRPAGNAQPRWPALRRYAWPGLFTSNMPPIHMPACPVSTMTIASSGARRESSRQMRSGRIGTAFDSKASRYFAAYSPQMVFTVSIHGLRRAAVLDSACVAMRSSVSRASPWIPTFSG